MARILIGTMPLTGHVLPGLPIARRLVERGHEVRWYSGTTFRSKIEATGAQFVPMQAGLDIDDASLNDALPGRAALKGIAQLKFDLKHAFADAIYGHVKDLEDVVQSFGPHVLLGDTGFAANAILSERHQIPWAAYSIMPLMMSSRDTPPGGLGLLPDTSLKGRLRDRALYFLINQVKFRDVVTHFNKVRTDLGAAASRGNVFDSMSPYLYLQATDSAFEYPRSDLARQVHFIGPFLPSASPDFVPPVWWDEMVNSTRPVIHVTQGTVATETDHLIGPTIQALANEDVLVVVTTGGRPVDSIQLASLPENVRVAPFIPHYHLLPHVSVMVTNGGYGGTQTALANGVPLVVAGATEDKPEVANRVAWTGTGINLRTGRPTVQQVRDAVLSVLTDPVYRENAQVMQENLRRHDAPNEAAVLIEQLAWTRRPVLRESFRSTSEMQAVPAL
jgi:MGT family glycosyltransferase